MLLFDITALCSGCDSCLLFCILRYFPFLLDECVLMVVQYVRHKNRSIESGHPDFFLTVTRFRSLPDPIPSKINDATTIHINSLKLIQCLPFVSENPPDPPDRHRAISNHHPLRPIKTVNLLCEYLLIR
jgi:hypothetical protein